MSKYKAYFNEYFIDKNPLQYLKENNTGEIGDSECLFENFHENKEWFLYEGENNITAVFEDNSRQTFKVHFHDNRGEDRHKHRTKAARTWKKLATEIRKNAGLNEVGNPIVIPWQECFQRALQDPLMKEFVDDYTATPIFENSTIGSSPILYWLSPSGKAIKSTSHPTTGSEILKSFGIKASGSGVYGEMFKRGYIRIIVGDSGYPFIVDAGIDPRPFTPEQRKWIEEISLELGLHGNYYDVHGRTRTLEGMLSELSFNDLRQSMKKYKTKADINNGTKTGSRSRERGAKSVSTKSLRVISTVGKDKQERETSLFSYKSEGSTTRWQGFIRFFEGFDKGGDGDVEVNCNCPDYRYVWAEPNADAGAGVTQKDGGFKVQAGFVGGGNENDPSKNQGIRNPNKVPGLCKHLIALAEYLDTAAAKVAPAKAGKEEPSAVAPKSDKPKKPMNVFPSQPTSPTGEKPVNIFESMKQFALQHPMFEVSYED